jgi:serine/threonine-protein kinase
MASVYKAYEPGLDRSVAVKVLPKEFLHDPTFAERFRREAQTVAKLEHPNIIPIYAYGIDEGVPWMSMRLIGGGALSGILKGSGRLPTTRFLHIVRSVAEALDYAHRAGVVHRDVKPQNILIDERDHVYLADFGLAKMMEGAPGLTQTGMIAGTPEYMAPEQGLGSAVDHRADIYALGVVAYACLTGRVPFTADTPLAVLMKHVRDPIPLPPAAEVPDPLMHVLLKALAKAPAERWPTAGAFADALRQLADVPTTQMPALPLAPTIVPAKTIQAEASQRPGGQRPPLPPQVPPRPPVHKAAGVTPWVLAAVAGLVLVAAIGAGVLFWMMRPSPPVVPEEPTRTTDASPTAGPPAVPPEEPASPSPFPTEAAPPSPTPGTDVPTPRPATPPPTTPRPGQETGRPGHVGSARTDARPPRRDAPAAPDPGADADTCAHAHAADRDALRARLDDRPRRRHAEPRPARHRSLQARQGQERATGRGGRPLQRGQGSHGGGPARAARRQRADGQLAQGQGRYRRGRQGHDQDEAQADARPAGEDHAVPPVVPGSTGLASTAS